MDLYHLECIFKIFTLGCRIELALGRKGKERKGKQRRRRKQISNFVCILLQLKEKCAASLGLFFIGDTKCPYKELILQSLLSLKEKNHIDLQFSVGESLSCLAAGKLCDSAEDPWNYENAIASPVVMTTGDDDMMEIVLKTVVGEYAFSTAPIVRQVIISII